MPRGGKPKLKGLKGKGLGKKVIGGLSGRIRASKQTIFILVVLVTILVFLENKFLIYPINILANIVTIVGAFMIIVFFDVIKRLKPVYIDEDLIYILVHMRTVVTGNPPINLLFKLVGDSECYSKTYRNLFKKIYVLIKHWSYASPDALRLVSKEAPNRVVEMFLQRLSAVLSLGADVGEYLRIEYNTLFSEYRTGYLRKIEGLRVILGVYSTLIGAFIFMLANFILLALFFGGEVEIIRTGILGVSLAELAVAILLFFAIKKSRFEHNMKIQPSRVRNIKIAAIGGAAACIPFLVILGKPFLSSLQLAPIVMVFIGLTFLPAGILAKRHENTIFELDDYFPVFIRAFGEHLSIVPNMAESLKPILVAQLGKLKKLIEKAFARLVNYIDPRIVWKYFAGESGSELIRRCTHIFIDTVEYGGDVKQAGILLSDHSNEIIRLRRNMLQVFKTFETTVYLMHSSSILLLTFITKLIVLFSKILSTFVKSIPPEFAGLFFMVSMSPQEIAFLIAIATFIMTTANAIALMAANPGSKYMVFLYASILMIVGGVSYYLGQYFMNALLSGFMSGYMQSFTSTPTS
ncbi:MAG: flagellar protein J [Crenarchaeota archaeon]|nr:flagellar protein J [Thermoproteota archaeon]